MTDLLLRIGVDNLVVSLVLAGAAWAVQTTGRRPLLAHLLWLLVFVKLVTPPLVTVPLIGVPGPPGSAQVATDPSATRLEGVAAAAIGSTAELASDPLPASRATSPVVERLKAGLVLLWLAGSAAVLAWSLVRVFRFHRLLRTATTVAPPELQHLASGIGDRLELRRTPTVYTTRAHVSPLVWWIGGRVRVVLPVTLCRGSTVSHDAASSEPGPESLRWILAHELAHVRRRDHFVRWLEWLACVAFWWNPVAWWARRNLRVNEELCCDALVLSRLRPLPRTYASSLLSVVEFLAAPAIRPPAVASEIDSGGSLERRFQMIISNRAVPATSRRLYTSVLLCAVALLPLGVAYSASSRASDEGAVRERAAAPADVFDHVRDHLKEHPLTEYLSDELIGKVLEAMPRVVHETLAEGERFQLDPDLREYFVLHLGLTHEQLELVVGLSRRIAPAVKERPEKSGIEDALRRVRGFLEENELTRDLTDRQIEAVLSGMRRIFHHIHAQGEPYELDPRLRQHFEELGLTEQQIELVLGLSRRVVHGLMHEGIEARYEKLGIGREKLHALLTHLHENGVPREHLEGVMGGILRAVHEMISEGEAFELDPRLHDHFVQRADLTNAQIQEVLAIARRIAASLMESGSPEHFEKLGIGTDEFRAIQMHLYRNGVPRESLEAVMGGLLRILFEMKNERERFQLDPRMRAHFEKLGIESEQIEQVQELAKRILHGLEEAHRAEREHRGGEQPGWETMRRRIEAAVRSGEITREEADAKYRAIKERMEAQERKKADL